MALVSVLVFVLGAGVVLATLLSAIHTVVLPRGVPVRLTRLVFRLVRSLFDLRGRRARSYEQRDSAMALYAPVSLLTLPLVWLATVLAGFTLMYWGVGVRPWGEAFAISGSSLLTLGFERPEGMVAEVVSFMEAALGFAVLALLLVTYLPSIYAAFSRREQQVALLEVRAGSPPSGVAMLERYARIEALGKLDEVWRSWEMWFVDIEETHTSLPALVFFRSPHPDRSWVTAAGAVLDGAALLVSTVDLRAAMPAGAREVRQPDADIMIRAGYIALRKVATYFRIPFDPDPSPDDPISIAREEFDEACERLAGAGVPLVADLDLAWRSFAGWRVNYDAVLLRLAALIMAPYAPWSSDRSLLPSRRRRFGRSLVGR